MGLPTQLSDRQIGLWHRAALDCVVACPGAAWVKPSQANRQHLSVSLGDPSFPPAIYACLVEGDGGKHSLIWSRPSNDARFAGRPAARHCVICSVLFAI